MADGVHANVYSVKPPGTDASLDCGSAQPESPQLAVRRDAMLSFGEDRDSFVWAVSMSHSDFQNAHVVHGLHLFA